MLDSLYNTCPKSVLPKDKTFTNQYYPLKQSFGEDLAVIAMAFYSSASGKTFSIGSIHLLPAYCHFFLNFRQSSITFLHYFSSSSAISLYTQISDLGPLLLIILRSPVPCSWLFCTNLRSVTVLFVYRPKSRE